ncbi:MAG: hypothetical protein ABIJ24_05810 [Nitrospinota bacterium]|nr:hypothetical protein [Nitrospinota bacterium]
MLSALAAISFLIGLHFFLSTYNAVRLNHKKLNVVASQVQFLRRNEREMAVKMVVMGEVNNFLATAKELGLERDRWVFHSVNINETMTFEQVVRIVGQTANSPSYYFKPTTLYLKKVSPSSPPASAPGQPAPSPGSVSLTLRGAFVVRQR